LHCFADPDSPCFLPLPSVTESDHRTAVRRLKDRPTDRGAEEASAMQAYMGAIWRCRHFWLALVGMDLRTRYRRSVLGIGWSLLQPICMTIIFCTVFYKLFGADPRTYAAYVLAGLAFWNYVMAVSVHSCQCFFYGEAYIRQ
jgi:ABC-type polysaccharide/polyol phosphate export permease